jgi:hypothetical protein
MDSPWKYTPGIQAVVERLQEWWWPTEIEIRGLGYPHLLDYLDIQSPFEVIVFAKGVSLLVDSGRLGDCSSEA